MVRSINVELLDPGHKDVFGGQDYANTVGAVALLLPQMALRADNCCCKRHCLFYRRVPQRQIGCPKRHDDLAHRRGQTANSEGELLSLTMTGN